MREPIVDPPQELEIDPVCGGTLDLELAREHALDIEYQGRVYLFCGPACRAHFERTPDRYAAAGRCAP